MPVELQYVQLITDKSDAVDLPCGIFIILIRLQYNAVTETRDRRSV